MHTQHWTRIIGSWENDARPVGWNFGRRSEIVLETRSGEKKVTMRERRGRERERERRFVRMCIRCYGYWIGLDCRVSRTNTQNLDVGRPLPVPVSNWNYTFPSTFDLSRRVVSFSLSRLHLPSREKERYRAYK